MKNTLSLIFTISVIWLFQGAFADVYIPDDELVGYVDSNDIYTVVGAVKNTNQYPVVPTIYLTVLSDGEQLGITQKLPTVFPIKDIPFKIKIPNAKHDAVILESRVDYEQDLLSSESKVAIIYDRSLTRHADGHLSGKLINRGNQTEYDIKIYATIHGQNNSFIDVAKNLEKIEKIEPGQILEFTMYPDPSLAKNVHYYSCFALGDETIVPLYANRGNERFDFRYDSTASFVVEGFDASGTNLSILGINSFKVPTYVNFEFPKINDNEKFTVLVDGNPVKSIQSIDDDGNWHVAFDVAGTAQNKILISGFKVPKPNAESEVLDTTFTDDASLATGSNYSFLYYVIPILIAGLAGVYVFSRKKMQHNV